MKLTENKTGSNRLMFKILISCTLQKYIKMAEKSKQSCEGRHTQYIFDDHHFLSFIFHGWVPVLISVARLILFIGLCVCICKACCGSSRSTGVVMHGANPGERYINQGVFAWFTRNTTIFIGRSLKMFSWIYM